MEGHGTGAPKESTIFDATHSFEDVKWTSISLTHVEYPKGNVGFYVLIKGSKIAM